MKDLKLGVWDRVILKNLLLSGDGRGVAKVEDQRKIFRLLDAGVEIKEAEAKKIHLRQEEVSDDKSITLWDKGVKDKKVELEDEDFEYLKKIVNERELTIDRRVTELRDKING